MDLERGIQQAVLDATREAVLEWLDDNSTRIHATIEGVVREQMEGYITGEMFPRIVERALRAAHTPSPRTGL
jgi:hypothetical protein